jgi:hypothetical protein
MISYPNMGSDDATNRLWDKNSETAMVPAAFPAAITALVRFAKKLWPKILFTNLL